MNLVRILRTLQNPSANDDQSKCERNQLENITGDAKKDFSEDNESVHSNMSIEETSPAQHEELPVKVEEKVSLVADPCINKEKNAEPSGNKDQLECKSEAPNADTKVVKEEENDAGPILNQNIAKPSTTDEQLLK